MSNEILFIAHDAGYTGAPLVLLSILRWLRKNTSIPFRILLRNPGPLESEYRQIAPVLLLGGGLGGVLSRRLRNQATLKYFNRWEQQILHQEYADKDIGLVYANTATNGRILESLSGLNCPVITHIHELENWIRYRIGEQDFNLTKTNTNCFIAVSETVKNNLIDNHAVPAEKIELVHEFIDSSSIQYLQKSSQYLSIRRELKIAEDSFIIGSCGTTDLRKGVDLFVRMEESVPRLIAGKPVHLVWVGREPGRWESRELEAVMRSARHNKRIHFVGEKPDPHPFFASFDVFALTSREDPFPLVMLEAAAHSKPIVCFQDAGGAPEFVSDDCGFCVPSLDVTGMASAVETLLSDENLLQIYGQNGKKKVVERHDVSVGASRILEVIQRYVAN